MNKQAISKAVAFLDSWLAYRARHVDIPGFSVSVLSGDEIIFSQVYGLADVEHKTPLTSQHLFHMASQTKMLTATAILQLVQADKIHLDDPVRQYLPWLNGHHDKRAKDITIRHLLNHSSGLLRDGNDSDHWLFKKPSPTKLAVQKAVLANDLVFAPGNGVKYSNLAFALLGQIIEGVSGKTFGDYIKQHILQFLALEAVELDYSDKLRNKIVTGYGLPFEHRRRPLLPRLPAKGLQPTTGIYTTTDNMCRFVSALFRGNEGLLGEKLKGEMQRPQNSLNHGYDQGTEFGFGHEFQLVGERLVTGHTGHVGGHVTATYYDPRAKIAVSVAANAKDAQSAMIARGIFGALNFFIQTPEQDVRERGSHFSARLVNEMSTIEIVHSGDKIVMVDPDDWEPFSWYETLEKVDDTTLRITTPGSIYNFGELLQYVFDGSAVRSAQLAGFTIRPEDKL